MTKNEKPATEPKDSRFIERTKLKIKARNARLTSAEKEDRQKRMGIRK